MPRGAAAVTAARAWLPHAQALAAMALMSAVFPTMKIALREVDARALYLARFGLAALAILALWCVAPPRVAHAGPRLWGWTAVLALLRGPAHQLLLGAAAVGASSGMLALLSATAPVHVAWMGALLLREPLRRRALVALVLALAGVLLPLVGRDLRIAAWSSLACGAAAAVIAGGSVVAARAMRASWGAWENATVAVVAAAALSLPLITPEVVAQLARAGAATWTCIAYQALAVQILGLWLLFAALARLPAATAALYQFLALVLAAGWGAALLGERYGAIDAVAMLVVIVAVAAQVGRQDDGARDAVAPRALASTARRASSF